MSNFDAWKTHRLWLELERRGPEATHVLSVLTVHMPNICKVLHDAGTGTEDFTLHDENHAWRVAERMVDILPEGLLAKLSVLDLGLLLFSAYLHDIGMSPGRARVIALRNYLLTGQWECKQTLTENTLLLNEPEREGFEEWLIENTTLQPGKTSAGNLTATYLGDVDEAIAYYCRSRHNDWSADWIQNNLPGVSALYTGWIEDLIRLCKSHHYGYEELRTEDYNPRPTPGTNQFVHLRYLACVLRVADVIEFDPERTPEVIFRHRKILPKSRIFWWKDKEISWILDREGRITISARPSDAKIHRAIEQTLADVERELRLCRRLADETYFPNYAGSPVLPHTWHLGVAVNSDVQPRSGTYHYINGAFRPNTKKVLELLGGLELYGDRLVAIRELLQNAFDAVREQIARQFLSDAHSAAPETLEALARTHTVTIRLERRGEDVCLICTDTGSGMSKEILERFFLVSGDSRRSDIDKLRRQCDARGIPLIRSGQFGIGVLSYFLLAERIVLQTRRSTESGETDGTGWLFETEGIGSFGELRPLRMWRKGTEICLYLRQSDDLADLNSLSGSVAAFLRDALRHIPCNFRYESLIQTTDSFHKAPGWFLNQNDIDSIVRRGFEGFNTEKLLQSPPSASLLPSHTLERQRRTAEQELATYKDFSRCLRWFTQEQALPDNKGIIRVHIPWFDLGGKGCLGYMKADHRDDVSGYRRIQTRDGWTELLRPEGGVIASWRGMAINARSRGSSGDMLGYSSEDTPGILEIDFWQAEIGTISVRRQEIKLSPMGSEVLRLARSFRLEVLYKAMEMLQGSELDYLNWNLIASFMQKDDHTTVPAKLNRFWVIQFDQTSDFYSFAAITLPSLASSHLADDEHYYTSANGPGKHTVMIPELLRYRRSWKDTEHSRSAHLGAFNRVLNYEGLSTRTCWYHFDNELFAVPMWEHTAEVARSPFCLPLTNFPPQWTAMAGANSQGILWNNSHPMILGVSQSALDWTKDKFTFFWDTIDPRPYSAELLQDRSKLCAWLVRLLSRDPERVVELWRALLEQEADLITSMLRMAIPQPNGADGKRILLFFLQADQFLLLSEDRAEILGSSQVIGSLLPELDEDWLLYFEWEE